MKVKIPLENLEVDYCAQGSIVFDISKEDLDRLIFLHAKSRNGKLNTLLTDSEYEEYYKLIDRIDDRGTVTIEKVDIVNNGYPIIDKYEIIQE